MGEETRPSGPFRGLELLNHFTQFVGTASSLVQCQNRTPFQTILMTALYSYKFCNYQSLNFFSFSCKSLSCYVCSYRSGSLSGLYFSILLRIRYTKLREPSVITSLCTSFVLKEVTNLNINTYRVSTKS